MSKSVVLIFSVAAQQITTNFCCCCWVTKLCPTLCTSWGAERQASIRYHLPEFSQVHVHWIGYAIQWSQPLSPTFSSCPQSFPTSGSFPMSWLFTSGGQSIGASASPSVFPINIQDWFPLQLTGLISLQSKGLSRVSSHTILQKHQFFGAQLSLWSNSHPYMITRKTSFNYTDLCWQSDISDF